MIEVTDRRLPEAAVDGSLDADGLDGELDLVLTERKARQLTSTARELFKGMSQLCGRAPVPGTRFVPVVITPAGGLGWNELVHKRATERLTELGTLRSSSVLPLCLLSVRDLRILEALTESGTDGGALMGRWRVETPGMPFDHFVLSEGLLLSRPSWEIQTFDAVIDELVARMQEHEITRPTGQ